MLFLNDTVSLQNSKIVSKIFSQHARQGVTSYINLFGDLYYGYLHPAVFMDRYAGLKYEFVNRLINNGPDIAHNLCMLELAQRENWRWPAPLTELTTELLWSAGNSRTVASGLVHEEPWTRLPVMLLQRRGTPADRYLAQHTRITTDQQLHTALGLEYQTNNDYHVPEMELQATLADDHGAPALLLKYIGNPSTEQDYHQIGQARLQQFQQWQQRYGIKPTIHVHTDHPDKLKNTVWNVVVAGTMPDRDSIYKPGLLEKVVIGQQSPHAHTLYVVGSCTVDLDDLLPWMDLEHDMYIDKNWQFALYRPNAVYNWQLMLNGADTGYKNRFISITQEWNKY